jgi:hypothetical protein
VHSSKALTSARRASPADHTFSAEWSEACARAVAKPHERASQKMSNRGRCNQMEKRQIANAGSTHKRAVMLCGVCMADRAKPVDHTSHRDVHEAPAHGAKSCTQRAVPEAGSSLRHGCEMRPSSLERFGDNLRRFRVVSCWVQMGGNCDCLQNMRDEKRSSQWDTPRKPTRGTSCATSGRNCAKPSLSCGASRAAPAGSLAEKSLASQPSRSGLWCDYPG